MKIKFIMFLILGISTAGICFAQSNPNNTGLPMGSNSYQPRDTNNPNSTSTTTSMNGNTSTSSGGSISSTSASAESRNASGSN